MRPWDLPEDVVRRALHGSADEYVWRVEDGADVVAACRARGVLITLAAVVHVRQAAIDESADAADRAWKEAPSPFPGRWEARVEEAVAAVAGIVDRARPWASALDADTEAALLVAKLVSREEARRHSFPAVLLAALVGAPLLWFAAVALVVGAAPEALRGLDPYDVIRMLGGVAAIGLVGGLSTLVAAGVERLRSPPNRAMGAPLRPGEAASSARTLARVGLLAAVLYIWGLMLGGTLAAWLLGPGGASPAAVGALPVAIVIAGGLVLQWRRALTT